MKKICLRFDIDGIADAKALPKIRKICADYNVKCTFFVNMGKSYDKRYPNPNPQKKKILKKGIWNSILTILINPNIGIKYYKYIGGK